MTSIQYLFNELWETPKDKLTWHSILNKAKEMHKQEIIDAWNGGDYAHFYSKETGRDFADGSEYYQETFVSKGNDDKNYTENNTDNYPELDGINNLIPQQETLYTEEQAIEFAKWLAENWFPMWVKDKFVWEHDWDKTCEEQKYKGYYNEKELFNLFLSLKQPKQ